MMAIADMNDADDIIRYYGSVDKYFRKSELDANIDVNWVSVSTFGILSHDDIRRYAKYLHWDIMSGTQDLPEDLIEAYAEFVDWACIGMYQSLSLQFVLKFMHKLQYLQDVLSKSSFSIDELKVLTPYMELDHWKTVCRYQIVDEQFIEEYASDKLEELMAIILLNQRVTEEFMDRHANIISSWSIVAYTQKMSEEFMIARYQNRRSWFVLMTKQDMSPEFIETNLDKLAFASLPMYHQLTENTIRILQNILDWNFVSEYQRNLSIVFIKEFRHKLTMNCSNIKNCILVEQQRRELKQICEFLQTPEIIVEQLILYV